MFENDDPLQRQRLIAVLLSSGLDAFEINSGGDVMHVVVPLLEGSPDSPKIRAQDPKIQADLQARIRVWPCVATLYIATNSLRTDCEIGLMGNYGTTGSQVTSTEWEPAASIEEALDIFQLRWNERDNWLKAFAQGDLDTL